MIRSVAAALAVTLSLARVAAAQDFTPDRTLIDKLERGDVMHVHDDNGGRMDLLAVLLASSHAKCEAMSQGFAKTAAYVAYLGSDSVTGKYPSREFTGMGLMAAIFNNDTTRTPEQESTFDAPWMLDPNGAAMLVIGSRGCNDQRFQTIVKNLFKTLDHHIAWHQQKLGLRAPLTAQTVKPLRIADWRTAIEQNVELDVESRVEKQFADLETRGATYLDCTYGPLNPDSTGTTSVNFWDKDVPEPGGDFLKISRKHPLADLGDIPLTACPANLTEAEQKRSESRNEAMRKVDPAALAPIPVAMELMLGQYYQNYLYVKQSWLSYQRTHNPSDLQHAIATKGVLLRSFGRPCPRGLETNITCQLSRQLNAEFSVIPDGPTSSAVPNTRVPEPSRRGDATAPSRSPRSAPAAEEQSRSDAGTPAASAAADAIPRGTALLVLTTAPIDLNASNQTYRMPLARDAQFRGGQVIAPAGSEVVIKVSEPQSIANGGMTVVWLTVEAIVINGKDVPVSTQPLMRPLSARGQPTRDGATVPANTRLVFVVGASGK